MAQLHRFGTPRDFATLAPITRSAIRFGARIVLRKLEPDFRKLFPPELSFASSYVRNRDLHPLNSEAIALATQHSSLSFMLKPAMYQLLCQPDFLLSNPTSLPSSSSSRIHSTQLGHHRIDQISRARLTMALQWSALCVNEVPRWIISLERWRDCKCSERGNLQSENFPDAETMRATQQSVALSNWMLTIHRPPSPSTMSEMQVEDMNTNRPSTINEIGMWDIIGGIQLLIDSSWKSVFCESCEIEGKMRWRERQEVVWNLLDEYFTVKS